MEFVISITLIALPLIDIRLQALRQNSPECVAIGKSYCRSGKYETWLNDLKRDKRETLKAIYSGKKPGPGLGKRLENFARFAKAIESLSTI